MSTTKNVLVVGARGFIAGYIIAALEQAGFNVLRGVRKANGELRENERYCDYSAMNTAQEWLPSLKDVDVVVNAAGILRETATQKFKAIHIVGPLTLADACTQAGVNQFIQISVLGSAEDGEFLATKHEFDQRLLALPLKSVVLRPSLVYSSSGSYGGTSLLRAIAGFPLVALQPSDGHWPMQPIACEDVAQLVVHAIINQTQGLFEAGGPEVMSLHEYQMQWRRWLNIAGKKVIPFPQWFIAAQVKVSDVIGSGPIGQTMWRMLQRGNVAQPQAYEKLAKDIGYSPKSLKQNLSARPSQVQDRWHAQLYFLAPTLRVMLILVWLISGYLGLFTDAGQIQAMAMNSFLENWQPALMARIFGVFDLLLAIWLATPWRTRWAIGLMGASVIGYSIVLGITAPLLWLDPLAGLAKNLVLIPAIAALWIMTDRR
ncbi:SDR family oxidoreductase [Pseudomonas sp. F1_0610]|uniref:SDR family oxidoreductase n=1 Tax=Pseudomonas sp. F1_0610 TaxID=3114284 RepID=UPI0039C17575